MALIRTLVITLAATALTASSAEAAPHWSAPKQVIAGARRSADAVIAGARGARHARRRAAGVATDGTNPVALSARSRAASARRSSSPARRPAASAPTSAPTVPAVAA